jgi:uncharacterized protein
MESNANLTWLLNDLATRVPEVEQVLTLSRDGLALDASDSLTREDAERLAAIAAGFQSLAKGTAEYLQAATTRQVIVDMAGKYLFITSAGKYGALAVVASGKAEMGLVAYEMAVLARKVGEHILAARRVMAAGRDT